MTPDPMTLFALKAIVTIAVWELARMLLFDKD